MVRIRIDDHTICCLNDTVGDRLIFDLQVTALTNVYCIKSEQQLQIVNEMILITLDLNTVSQMKNGPTENYLKILNLRF